MPEQLARPGMSQAGPAFRPIHYLGNKSRVLGAIEAAVDSVAGAGQRVCDLFAGSGVVAQRLGLRRGVIAADVQEYSRVVTSAMLNPVSLPDVLLRSMLREARRQEQLVRGSCPPGLFGYEERAIASALVSCPQPLCDIVEYGSAVAVAAGDAVFPEKLALLLRQLTADLPAGPATVMTRYYGGVYYSYRQAIALDGLATGIRNLPAKYRDTALAALLSTASDLVSTVGNQFAQPVRPRAADKKPKAGLLAVVARKRQRPVADTYRTWLDRYHRLPRTRARHQVIQDDFRAVLAALPRDVAAIYADPPYTRDHYSRFYHVLETIALGDEPDVSTMKAGTRVQLSRALYRAERHQSPFCIKTEADGAFRFLFSSAAQKNIPLVVSYSPLSPGTAARPRTRLLTVSQLLDLAKEHFRDVRIESAGRIAHSKLNAEHLNARTSYEAEILVIARP
jgi:adenine-specific DNA-methyltransferase